ncbi:protein FAM117A-like [Leptonychotes weddellii]|uniref:Protein FAM117A-like n=1 Tax=Leptonychotes weddellii TaxID=9713 RepID=A0A7F8PWC4_LEPWE|nr:protein FAM117A-like [Leptonychotes weddellii]
MQNLRGGKTQDMGGKWFIVQLVQDIETLKRSEMYRKASVPCSVAPEKSVCRPQPPQVRRTFSLDTILSSYLLGQWPRDADGAFTCCTNDKATQTPLSWQELEGERASSCTHKRSASWGSTDHRKEVCAPFDSLATAAASCPRPAPWMCLLQSGLTSSVSLAFSG